MVCLDRCYCLKVVTDVKTTRCYDLIYYNGRCYCQDVIVVDVISINCFNMLYGKCYFPCSRWNNHCRVGVFVADLGHVADGIATGSVYFNFSSKVLNRTSFHMCGRWYLPIFLLRDGLLTLMYKASLIVLMRFWSSLPTILKFSIVTL